MGKMGEKLLNNVVSQEDRKSAQFAQVNQSSSFFVAACFWNYQKKLMFDVLAGCFNIIQFCLYFFVLMNVAIESVCCHIPQRCFDLTFFLRQWGFGKNEQLPPPHRPLSLHPRLFTQGGILMNCNMGGILCYVYSTQMERCWRVFFQSNPKLCCLQIGQT